MVLIIIVVNFKPKDGIQGGQGKYFLRVPYTRDEVLPSRSVSATHPSWERDPLA